jgi:hypothetical protein
MIILSRRLILSLCLAIMGLVIAATTQPGEAAPRRLAPRATGADRVDPAAVAAFHRMANYVAGLNAFEFRTTYTFDVVAKNGQTITVDGTGHYVAKRPDRLAVDLENDLFTRRYVYDGKTLVVVSPGERYFAQVAAPPTIREMLITAAKEFAIEIPIADLFDLGTPHAPIHHVRSAFLVGTSVIDGTDVEHWAFRTRDRDWEVWIRTGDKPLPVRFSVVAREQRALPRYSVTMKWTDRTDISDTEFAFAPSTGQYRIEILRIGKAKGAR